MIYLFLFVTLNYYIPVGYADSYQELAALTIPSGPVGEQEVGARVTPSVQERVQYRFLQKKLNHLVEHPRPWEKRLRLAVAGGLSALVAWGVTNAVIWWVDHDHYATHQLQAAHEALWARYMRERAILTATTYCDDLERLLRQAHGPIPSSPPNQVFSPAAERRMKVKPPTPCSQKSAITTYQKVMLFVLCAVLAYPALALLCARKPTPYADTLEALVADFPLERPFIPTIFIPLFVRLYDRLQASGGSLGLCDDEAQRLMMLLDAYVYAGLHGEEMHC